MSSFRRLRLLAAASLLVNQASASFHLMQIEQAIGGVDGDLNAQAVQLRMRFGGQSLIGQARLRAWDATGANPVLLIDFTGSVSNAAAGDRILVASAKFKELYPGIAVDATLTILIPPSYLAAGKLTFEQDDGTVMWSLAWGGSAFTGTNVGSTNNDSDGDFGAPFAGPLPSTSKQTVSFTGAAADPSTTNVAQYALSADPATVHNNAGASLGLSAVATPPVLIYQGTGAAAVSTASASIKRPGKVYVIVDSATSSVSVVETFTGASGRHQITLLDTVLQPITTNGDKTTTFFRALASGAPGTAGYAAEFDDFSGAKASLRTGKNPVSTSVAASSLKGTIDRRDSTASAENSVHLKLTVPFNAKRTQSANDAGQTAANVLTGLQQELSAQGFTPVQAFD